MDEEFYTTPSQASKDLDTSLTLTGLGAMGTAALLGGEAATPLMLLGSLCAAGLVVNSLNRPSTGDDWGSSERDDAATAVSAVGAANPAAQLPAKWVETVQAGRSRERTR